MEKVLVSACLIGNNCKYNGKNNKNEKIMQYLKDKEAILVCPEVMGGMDTPRLKSEIASNEKELKVINEKGVDVTSYFVKGASIALKRALFIGVICTAGSHGLVGVVSAPGGLRTR